MLLSAVTSPKSWMKILQEKHSRRRSSAIITYYQVHLIFMLQLNIASVRRSPRYPGSMTLLLRQFATAENWKKTWYKDKTNSELFTAFYCQCRLVAKAEHEFFQNSIVENSNNYRKIYTSVISFLVEPRNHPYHQGSPTRS